MRMLKGAISAIAVAMSIAGCTQQKTGIEAAADAMGATNIARAVPYDNLKKAIGVIPVDAE